MHRWVLSLVLMAMAGAGCDVLSPPERRSCERFASLCGLDQEATGQCRKQVSGMSQNLGKERTDWLAKCVAEARSCPEAGGCMAGAGLSALGDTANKFLKGLGKALSN